MTYNADSTFPRMLRMIIRGGLDDRRSGNAYKYPDIAKAIGVNEATLWRWSTGKNAPKLTDLYKLAEYFDIPVWVLIEPLESKERTEYEITKLEILRSLAKKA